MNLHKLELAHLILYFSYYRKNGMVVRDLIMLKHSLIKDIMARIVGAHNKIVLDYYRMMALIGIKQETAIYGTKTVYIPMIHYLRSMIGLVLMRVVRL